MYNDYIIKTSFSYLIYLKIKPKHFNEKYSNYEMKFFKTNRDKNVIL